MARTSVIVFFEEELWIHILPFIPTAISNAIFCPNESSSGLSDAEKERARLMEHLKESPPLSSP